MNTMVRIRGVWITGFLLMLITGMAQGEEPIRIQVETNVPEGLKTKLEAVFGHFDERFVATGVLYDRVVPFSNIRAFDGTEGSPAVRLPHWRQMYYEMHRASLTPDALPGLNHLRERAASAVDEGVIPLAVLDYVYNQIRADALAEGMVEVRGEAIYPVPQISGDLMDTRRVFTVAPLSAHSYRDRVEFVLLPEHIFTNRDAEMLSVEIDFDDGSGFRRIEPGEPIAAHYDAPGDRELRVRAVYSDGVAHAAFNFTARKFNELPYESNVPDIYWENEVSTIPYLGQYAAYDAYIFLGEGNAVLTKPLLFVEGFDLDNSLGWPELYGLISQEGMADSISARGYDLIIMNFHSATDYLQRNSFAFVTLVEKIIAEQAGDDPLVVAGASMGGLIGRYGLAWMEDNGIDHQSELFVSFDTPHQGATLPLGDQYWIEFFADHNSEAEAILALLDAPGAQQMLVYHHVTEPDPSVNPLRLEFLGDLAAVGSYPSDPGLRMVAIANGSGAGVSGAQRCNDGSLMQPGDQILEWDYNSLFVDITGDVWAVPDISPQTMILDAKIDQIWPLPNYGLQVYASGTLPYDNAPGGHRGTQAEMAAVDTDGLGDITTDCDNHCFIPTVSALDLRDTGGNPRPLFYDLNGDPDVAGGSPFDAVYFPSADDNEEHVAVTAGNTAFLASQLDLAPVTVDLNLVNASGDGNFTYTMSFENTTGVTQNVDLWAEISGPDSYFELVFVKNKNFGAGAAANKSKGHTLGAATTGDYTMTLYSGTYPSTVLDSDSEVYSKTSLLAPQQPLTEVELLPSETVLQQNYPNPFNPDTMIRFGLDQESIVRIAIYDVLGQQVRSLMSRRLDAGWHELTWDGKGDAGTALSSGIYLYRMQAGEFFQTRRMLLMR